MTLLDHFAWPAAGVLLVLVALLWFVAWGLDASARRAVQRTLGSRAGSLGNELGRRRRRLRRVLLVAASACGVLALMQPLWGEAQKVEQRGVDIAVCLDLSRSMQARDLAPSRLLCAQREIVALSERARGDRLGLVVFAGEAQVSVPLTQDVDSFAALVEQIHTMGSLRAGTDLGQALDVALGTLIGSDGGHETILLLTDGEDHGGKGLRAAQACREQGVTVHCVGFGSDRGSKIAVGEAGRETWLRDAAGNDVVSAVDTAALRSIADATGGELAVATAAGDTLVRLYDRRVRSMARKALAAAQLQARGNRFQWPLALALLLWLAEMAMSDRVRRRAARPLSALADDGAVVDAGRP